MYQLQCSPLFHIIFTYHKIVERQQLCTVYISIDWLNLKVIHKFPTAKSSSKIGAYKSYGIFANDLFIPTMSITLNVAAQKIKLLYFFLPG